MANRGQYGIFKVMATCPHCGHPVPVNGPMLQIVCPSCQKKVEIPAGSWHGMLGDYLKEYGSLGPGGGSNTTLMAEVALKYSYVRLPPPAPACPACETNWNLETVADGDDGDLSCKKCGRKTPTFPAPAWLQAGVPIAKQIFFGEREAETAAGVDESADQPIAMACPKCGGGLLVTAKDERILRCKYCNTDVYLPDALWLKLHPAKEAKFWLVRFRRG